MNLDTNAPVISIIGQCTFSSPSSEISPFLCITTFYIPIFPTRYLKNNPLNKIMKLRNDETNNFWFDLIKYIYYNP